MSPWSTPTSLWTRFWESVISFDWFFSIQVSLIFKNALVSTCLTSFCTMWIVKWIQFLLQSSWQCLKWSESLLADCSDMWVGRGAEEEQYLRRSWRLKLCQVGIFFQTLITWKPKVQHKSDASQNDQNCKGYTFKIPAAALNMQRLTHCGRQSLRRRHRQK